MFKKSILLAIFCLVVVHADQEKRDLGDNDDVTMDVAVKLKNEYSDDVVSDLFAISHDLVKIAKAIEIDKNGLFHFRIKNPEFYEEDMRPTQIKGHRTKRHIENKIDKLRTDTRVEYVEPQEYLTREKRAFLDELTQRELDELLVNYDSEPVYDSAENIEDRDMETIFTDLLEGKYSEKLGRRKSMLHHFEDELLNPVNKVHLNDLPKEIDFNDKVYGKQWYLINEGQLDIPSGFDMNVKDAWLNGYTGKNVSIVIIDDGLDHEHPDFEGKYRPDLSYDLNDESDKEHDPMPSSFDNNNNHGTKCAGAAAAKANNRNCGVGVAYNADIGGIRVLDGKVTDMLEARALLFKMNDTDIKTLSWGPSDDGTHMEHPRKFVSEALEKSAKEGRNGKGTLFIWASGNGGDNDDDCSCDGYVSNWNAISVGSVNHHGLSPYFSEHCPSTMAVIPTGGRSKYGGSEDDPGIRVSTTDVRGECVTDFQGTSAAAPIAAGALALVLESNPDLTNRDVMHLIARTSRVPNIEDKEGWIINGANYHVNDKYGFGMMDVAQMVQEAQGWENVPPREKCTVYSNKKLPTFTTENQPVETDITVSDECSKIDFLEHVVANISFSYPIRGEVQLTLISPFGTPSEILSFRSNDDNKFGIRFFPFMTVFNWGESPVGKWRLIVKLKENDQYLEGSIDHFSLNFYGFKVPQKFNTNKRSHGLTKAYVPSGEHLEEIYKKEMEQSHKTKIVHKRILESQPELREAMKAEEN